MTSYRLLGITGVVLLAGSLAAEETASQQIANSAPLSRYEFLKIRMAIPVRITVYAPDEATANQVTDRAYARFLELDRLLSDYDPDSELSRLCRDALPGKPRKVSPELFTVLKHAEQVSRQTHGAFDVTIGPVTDLWRKIRRRGTLPSDDERLHALRRVGWKSVRLCETDRTVELLHQNMRLDLGGIAKGYAADEALRLMAQMGVSVALVDAGGDIVVGDPPPGQDNWRIGIAPIDDPRGAPEGFLVLHNASVATSGDASQHVEIDGIRYSHIVNPRTGIGVTTPSSVTVIATDGITADSLASAVSVLGPKRGIDLVNSLDGVEAFVVTRSAEGNLDRRASTGYGRYQSEAK